MGNLSLFIYLAITKGKVSGQGCCDHNMFSDLVISFHIQSVISSNQWSHPISDLRSRILTGNSIKVKFNYIVFLWGFDVAVPYTVIYLQVQMVLRYGKKKTRNVFKKDCSINTMFYRQWFFPWRHMGMPGALVKISIHRLLSPRPIPLEALGIC